MDIRMILNLRRFALISAAAAVVLGVSSARAALLTTNYVSGQIADDSNFSVNLTAISLSGASPTINITAGKYFRFGLAGSVTSNPNSTAGGAWDISNQNFNGNPAQPSNLGLAVFGMSFGTTGSLTSIAAPLSSGTAPAREFTSFVVGFDNTEKGDVVGGKVGNLFPLGGGFASANSTQASGIAKLTAVTNSTTLFTNVRWQAVTAGSTSITPTFATSAVGFWSPSSAGTTSNGTSSGAPLTDATYNSRIFNGTSDAITALPSITVNVVPEPASLGVVGVMGLLLAARRRRRQVAR